MLKKVVFFLAAVTLALAGQVHAADHPRTQHVTAALYASSLLLGTQLGAKSGAEQGKTPPSVLECLLSLDAASLTDLVESVLVASLTPAELQAADAFFESSAGKKYAKLGTLDLYLSAGEVPPEDAPSISPEENKEIAQFNGTATNKKLWNALNGASARRVFGTRLLELEKACGAGKRKQ
ncbi:MAG: DUF2059 domain-containing protein [Proteobacteria bacterium]|nr:DUF2059 domain-containing protein [Pseudomonadota bacterium]